MSQEELQQLIRSNPDSILAKCYDLGFHKGYQLAKRVQEEKETVNG